MTGSKQIAMARFVMRERQYLSAIRPLGEGLVLHTMHYADEVLSLDDALPSALSRTKSGAKEIQAAEQLIRTMTRRLDLSSFKDEYREKLEELVERRKEGKTVEVADEPEKPLPRTVNLMDALRRSLRSAGDHSNGNGHHPARKRVPRRPRTAHARTR